MGACGIDEKLLGPSSTRCDGAKNALGRRRSANIAHADEKNADFVLHRRFPVEKHRSRESIMSRPVLARRTSLP